MGPGDGDLSPMGLLERAIQENQQANLLFRLRNCEAISKTSKPPKE